MRPPPIPRWVAGSAPASLFATMVSVWWVIQSEHEVGTRASRYRVTYDGDV